MMVRTYAHGEIDERYLRHRRYVTQDDAWARVIVDEWCLLQDGTLVRRDVKIERKQGFGVDVRSGQLGG